MRTPVTPKLLSLYKDHPPISDSFPVQVPGGNTITDLTGHCAECNEPIPQEHFRGTVTDAFGVVVVEAVGVCHACRLLTKFLYRFRPDGTIDTLDRENRWVRRRFESRRQTAGRFLSTLKARARRLAAKAAVALLLLSPVIAWYIARHR